MSEAARAPQAEIAFDADAAMPVSRAERRDQQMQRIMDAAKSCFVRHGFQGASMQQICSECGMSPGALYRYFSSKEAIVEAICAVDRKEDADSFIALLSNPSVVDGLVDAAVAHIRHIHERNNAALFAEIRAESMRNEAVRETCDLSRGPVAEIIHAHLHQAIDRGEIAPVVDIMSLMGVLMAVGEGMALNDLPALGIPVEKLEVALRAMVIGLLRPRGTVAVSE